MSTTSAALDWLLSLSATFTSSPIPNSDPPDFTDWLQVSPTTSSPAPLSSSPAFQNITCSPRINLPQENQDLGLNYVYDLSGYFSCSVSASGSQSGQSTHDPTCGDMLPRSVHPALFNEHHRMTSLESTSSTLVNTPPKTRAILPALADLFRDDNAGSPFGSSSFRSPATKLIEDLQSASYGHYYTDIAGPSLQAQVAADISPVVRAADIKDRLPLGDFTLNEPKRKTKGKKSRRKKQKDNGLSFVQQLQAVETPQPSLVSEQVSREPVPKTEISTIFSPSCTASAPENMLLSPCRLKATQSSISSHHETIPQLPTSRALVPKDLGNLWYTPSTPPQDHMAIEALSPLTPLPCLTSSPDSPPRLKIVLNLKRTFNNNAASPIRRSKRARKSVAVVESPSPSPSSNSSHSVSSVTQEAPVGSVQTVYTNRTVPATIEVSDKFPLFYRRFPASSYYQHGSST